MPKKRPLNKSELPVLPDPVPSILTRYETASYTRNGIGTIDKWLADGRLRGFTVSGGRTIHIRKSDVDALLFGADAES